MMLKSYKSVFKEKTYYTNLSAYELTEDPSNLVSVEEYFCNPFAYPLEVEHATNIVFKLECNSDPNKYKDYFKTSGQESIDVKMIVPTQRFLKRDKLEKWVFSSKDQDANYPELMKFGEFYYLLDGHHRVAKEIESGCEYVIGSVILVSSSQITTESVELKPYKSIYENMEIPFEVGDEILGGKFKNKRMTVTGFDVDDNNQPQVKTNKGNQNLFKFRIAKLMPPKE